jgi:hypothetical protein
MGNASFENWDLAYISDSARFLGFIVTVCNLSEHRDICDEDDQIAVRCRRRRSAGSADQVGGHLQHHGPKLVPVVYFLSVITRCCYGCFGSDGSAE